MWRTSHRLCCTTWLPVSIVASGITPGNVPASEEGVCSVDIVDHLDRLHGRIQTFSNRLFQFIGWMSQFASEMAQERSEQKHLDVVVTWNIRSQVRRREKVMV